MTAIPRNTARLPARLRLLPVVCNSFALIPPLLIFRKTSLFKGSARSLLLAGISSEGIPKNAPHFAFLLLYNRSSSALQITARSLADHLRSPDQSI